jgi:hypothetical protein
MSFSKLQKSRVCAAVITSFILSGCGSKNPVNFSSDRDSAQTTRFEAAVPEKLADVLTQHNDNSRTGANLGETVLNPINVRTGTFGKLFTLPVDGQVYAQPLIASAVDLGAAGTKNVAIVATMHNSVYAFDAETGEQIWNLNAGPSLPVSDFGFYLDIANEVGILSTPVIDKANNGVYFVSLTKENGTYHSRLHLVDLRTGAEKAHSPIEIAGSVPGTGQGSANGFVAFNAFQHLQRAALLFSKGMIHIAYGSHADQTPYHGWMFAYDAITLQQKGIYNSSPNSGGAGFWQSGQGPAADDQGNIYVVTGNGIGSDPSKIDERTDSYLKFNMSGSGYQLLDYFTASDWQYLDDADLDLGVSGTMLIPGTDLFIGGSKLGEVYVMKKDNLGKLTNNDSGVYQKFSNNSGHIHGTMVHWASQSGSRVYVMGENDYLKSFKFDGTYFSTNPDMQSTITAEKNSMPGGILSVSANGNQPESGIIWANLVQAGDANHATRPGVLRAFKAEDLSQEIWNSDQNASRDAVGAFAKFAAPTIANGKVYLATFSNRVNVYGLVDGTNQPPVGAPPAPAVGSGIAANIYLKTLSGNFLTASNGGVGALTAAATIASNFEVLSVFDLTSSDLLSGDTVSLRVSNKDYISAECGGGPDTQPGYNCGMVNANRAQAQGWEQFKIYKKGGRTGDPIGSDDVVSLKSLNNFYCSAENGGGSSVTCNRGAALGWEEFTIKVSKPTNSVLNQFVTGANLHLKSSNNYYVCAENGGGGDVTVSRTAAQGWETLTLQLSTGQGLKSGDVIAFQSANGQFFSAECGGGTGTQWGYNCGSVHANRTAVAGWEQFTVQKVGGSAGPIIVEGDQITVKSSGGFYCAAENVGGPGQPLVCNRAAASTFTISH